MGGPKTRARKSVAMTVAAARRKDDVRSAIVRLTEIVGDDHRIEHHFDPSDSRFTDLLETTWRELLDADLLEDRGRLLVMSSAGWLTGLRLSGQLQSDKVRSRATLMVRALKARVKGRRGIHDELLDVRELAEEIALPVGWLFNAIESHLLQRVFPKDRMNATLDSRHKLLIKIPPTFGSDPIQLE